MRASCVLPDAYEARKAIRHRAPFTPDPSQLDIENALARSAIEDLQTLPLECGGKSPRPKVGKSPHFEGVNHHVRGVNHHTPDIGYLHTGLAQCALPRSAVKGDTFTRRNGERTLLIQAGSWTDKNGAEIAQPIPYGTRPRLILYHLCAEAVRKQSRIIDMKRSARAFLQHIGIDIGGKPLADFRLQLRALAVCRMKMTDPKGEFRTLKCEPIRGYNDTDDGEWIPELKLSEEFFDEVVAHPMPMDLHAIAKLQNSALALDTYSWLAECLHRIKDPQVISISWNNLHSQMGHEYANVKYFKREMKTVLARVCAVYPDAKVEFLPGRLLLKKSLSSVPPKAPKPPAASSEQLDMIVKHGPHKGLTMREALTKVANPTRAAR